MINLGELVLIIIGIIAFIYYNTYLDNTDDKVIRYIILFDVIVLVLEIAQEISIIRYQESKNKYHLCNDNLKYLKGHSNESLTFISVFSTHPIFSGF